MAIGPAELLGKWQARVSRWTWEYVFAANGTVTWRDPLNNESGSGNWAASGSLVNIWWRDSTSRESLKLPLNTAKQSGWYASEYYTGPYELRKLETAEPANKTSPAGLLSVANFVDAYTGIVYDMNYKFPRDRPFAYSSILQLVYADGARLEFDFEKELSEVTLGSDALFEAFSQASVGPAQRIFPKVLNFQTVPRLWRASLDARQQQDDDAKFMMGMMIAATSHALSVPALPAGAPSPAAIRGTPVRRQAVAGTRVQPAQIVGDAVRYGPGNAPGSLHARIMKTNEGVIYEVGQIFLKGEGERVAVARATHREMIKRAARMAQQSGQRQFKMVGNQGSPDYVAHAQKLANEAGVPGSFRQMNDPTIGYPNYEVILDVGKVLSGP